MHDGPADGPVERACRLLCEIAIVMLAVLVVAEIITRNVFGFSMELSDEVGGYIIVGVTFLSLSVCQTSRSYHHVEMVLSRVPRRGQAGLRLFYDLLSLAFAGVMIWQLGRIELRSFQSGDTAPTVLATPIWLPQLFMVVGMLAATWSLVRSALWHLRDLRRRS